MKKFFTWIGILSVVVLTLSLSACSKSEDPESIADNTFVEGVWFGYACANSDASNLDTNHTLRLVLKINSYTGEYTGEYAGEYAENEAGNTNKCSFAYTMDGLYKGKAYISSKGTTIYFMLGEGDNRDKMFVYGHGYGDDLDFVLTNQR